MGGTRRIPSPVWRPALREPVLLLRGYGYRPYGIGYWYAGYRPYSYGYGYGYGYGYSPYYYGTGYGYGTLDHYLGALRLQVRPRHAEVLVDGYYAGRVDDFDGAFQRLRLEEGTYEIAIEAPGYVPLVFDVRLLPDKRFAIEASCVGCPSSPAHREMLTRALEALDAQLRATGPLK